MRAGVSLGWVAVGRGFAHGVTSGEVFGTLRGVVGAVLCWQQCSVLVSELRAGLG